MDIAFSPMRSDAPLTAAVNGDVLTLNGEAFDFSVIPEGATLPSSAVSTDWLVGDIQRQNGVIKLTLILPHGPNPTEAAAYPKPLIGQPDGPLDLPK